MGIQRNNLILKNGVEFRKKENNGKSIGINTNN